MSCRRIIPISPGAPANPHWYSAMLSTVFFPELLLAFSEEHPENAVSLEEYGSVRACNLVQDDTLDWRLSIWNSII